MPLSLRPFFSAIGLLVLCLASAPAWAQAEPGDGALIDAREAFRKKDGERLIPLRDQIVAARHPLAAWADYWALNLRLSEAKVEEVEAFYARWPGHYVEDRLRNDWLLELGKRRDWAAFMRDVPRFRMNDDREVTCYRLLTLHLARNDVRAEAREAWFAQRELDDGCQHMAETLAAAGVFKTDDLWRKARLAMEAQRPRVARAAVALVGDTAAREFDLAMDNPMRYLRVGNRPAGRADAEVALLAALRTAANDAEATAAMLDEIGADRLGGRERLAWAMAYTARRLAFKLSGDAATRYDRAFKLLPRLERDQPSWSDETLAWAARSALRVTPDAARWPQVLRAIDAMPSSMAQDDVWLYWRARALAATAPAGEPGDALRREAQALWRTMSSPLSFYGKLALDALGEAPTLPPPPAAITAEERAAARGHGGLARALQLIGIGLRSEGVREWNYSLRGMDERSLLAAAQLACEREVWDRCISTSSRTRQEVDVSQRFPMPLRDAVEANAREAGLDPAYVYGLIRQESRFVADARSGAGAGGLMQVMPGTARWTARKIGLTYSPGMVVDREFNLKLGTSYLKLLLDDFQGSPLMAAAAYNAGPNRPRRWREGATLEPAVWAENVPFNETRDYVKQVLSNTAIYAALRNGQRPHLKPWLGPQVGPRDTQAPPVNTDLP